MVTAIKDGHSISEEYGTFLPTFTKKMILDRQEWFVLDHFVVFLFLILLSPVSFHVPADKITFKPKHRDN